MKTALQTKTLSFNHQPGEELHRAAQQVLHAVDQRHSDKGLEDSGFSSFYNPFHHQTLKCPDSAGVLRVKLIRYGLTLFH